MKFSKIPALLVGFFALMASNSSHASTTGGFGYISGVYATQNGAVLFSVSGTARSGVPSCGASNPNRWALDASTVPGQAQVAVLLSAWAAHKQVWVTGTGSCSIWGDTETVQFFNMQD